MRVRWMEFNASLVWLMFVNYFNDCLAFTLLVVSNLFASSQFPYNFSRSSSLFQEKEKTD
jgi:hypothetical protein